MVRYFARILVASTLALGIVGAASTPAEATFEAEPQACCKICHKGKACGDSCIARYKQCHQPPGCACDG